MNDQTIPSDKNLKENIESIHDCSALMDLRPVSYNIKGGTKIQFGFIAQEVEQTDIENIVFKNNLGVRSIAYNQIIPLLVLQNQQLMKRVAELEKRLHS